MAERPAWRRRFLQSVLQCQAVDHGGEHTHSVGAGAIHADLTGHRATKNITAADHEREFAAQFFDFFDFLRKSFNGLGINAVLLWASEDLAGDFEDNTLVS